MCATCNQNTDHGTRTGNPGTRLVTGPPKQCQIVMLDCIKPWRLVVTRDSGFVIRDLRGREVSRPRTCFFHTAQHCERRAARLHNSRFAIRVIRDCWEKSENAREERRECLLDKHAHAVYQITNCESRINSNKRNKSVKHPELTILHRVGTLLTLCFHHQASS